MPNIPKQFNTLDKEVWIGKDLFSNTTYMICRLGGQDPVGLLLFDINESIIENTVLIKNKPKSYLVSALKSLS